MLRTGLSLIQVYLMLSLPSHSSHPLPWLLGLGASWRQSLCPGLLCTQVPDTRLVYDEQSVEQMNTFTKWIKESSLDWASYRCFLRMHCKLCFWRWKRLTANMRWVPSRQVQTVTDDGELCPQQLVSAPLHPLVDWGTFHSVEDVRQHRAAEAVTPGFISTCDMGHTWPRCDPLCPLSTKSRGLCRTRPSLLCLNCCITFTHFYLVPSQWSELFNFAVVFWLLKTSSYFIICHMR